MHSHLHCWGELFIAYASLQTLIFACYIAFGSGLARFAWLIKGSAAWLSRHEPVIYRRARDITRSTVFVFVFCGTNRLVSPWLSGWSVHRGWIEVQWALGIELAGLALCLVCTVWQGKSTWWRMRAFASRLSGLVERLTTAADLAEALEVKTNELAARAAELQAAIDANPQPIARGNLSGQILYINPALSRDFKQSAEDLLSGGYARLKPEAYAAQEAVYIAEMKRGERTSYTMPAVPYYVSRPGEPVEIRRANLSVTLYDREPGLLLGVLVWVEDALRLEEQLRAKAAELEAVNADFARANLALIAAGIDKMGDDKMRGEGG